MGGDEFCLVVPGLNEESIREKLWNANLKLNKISLSPKIDFPLTLNFGVAQGKETIATLYHSADNDLEVYKKKIYEKLHMERRQGGR